MPTLPPHDTVFPCCGPRSVDACADCPPGEQGPNGLNGTNGTNGANAYTTTTAQFEQPAASATVTVAVVSTAWMAQGQVLFMSVGGFYQVSSITDVTHVVLTNLGYSANATPTTVIASDQNLVPSGPQGDEGTLSGAAGGVLTGTYPNPGMAATGVTASPGGTPNYTKVAVGADGRITSTASLIAADIPSLPASQITSGTIAIANGGTGQSTAATAFSALIAGSTVPLANGGTGQTTAAASFIALAPLTTAGDLIIEGAGGAPGRLAVGTHDQGMRVNASSLLPEWRKQSYDLLGSASCNANVTTDTAIPIWSNKYVIDFIEAFDASTSLTTVVGGIYTGAGKGGVPLVAASQAYSALTAASKFLNLTLATTAGAATTDYQTATTLYFSPTTAQGATATVTVSVFGRNLG